MRVVDVKPKDICVLVEMGLSEIEKVLDFLDGSIVEFDSEKNKKLSDAVDYVKSDFYPKLLEVFNTVGKDA